MNNTKRNRHLGGGEESKTSLFKPLVASSLALALGVSVAVADPTIQYGSNGVATNNLGLSNLVWTAGDNNSLKPTSNGVDITKLYVVFDKTSTSPIGSVNSSVYTISYQGNTTSDNTIKITSTQALKVNNLSINFGSPGFESSKRRFILDLSSVNTGNYSFIGDIQIHSGTGNTVEDTKGGHARFEGKFGKSIKGNIIIDTGVESKWYGSSDNDFTFSNGANIEGNVTVYNTTRSVFRFEGKNGTINGSINSLIKRIDSNYTWTSESGERIIFQDLKTVTGGVISFDSKTSFLFSNAQNQIDLSGYNKIKLYSGEITFGFTDDVVGDNKTLIFNTAEDASDTDRSLVDISGGHLVFDGIKQVIFNNGNGDSGNGTLLIKPATVDEELTTGVATNEVENVTYQNGSVKFLIDSTAQAEKSSPIVKGNINATSASVIFAHKSVATGVNPFTSDSVDASALSTYYVDGNITITDGGFSAFWDDNYGFTGKIATTDSYSFTQNGGLIGKNDAWFESGSITKSISTIQATTNGASHLVFGDSIDITGKDGTAIFSNSGNSAMILFKNGATIEGNIKAKGGSNSIYAKSLTTNNTAVIANNGSNYIYIKSGNTTINGGVDNQGENTGNYAVLTWGGSNIFNLENDANLTITNGLYHRWNAKKTEFNISGDNSTLMIKNIAVDGDGGEGLKINFTGENGTFKIGSMSSDVFTTGTLTNGNSGAGKTNITFANSGTIQGNITTKNSSTTNITFGTQDSPSTGINSTDGTITTSSGTSNLTFNGGTSNTINSFIQTTGGTNNVRFNNSEANTITNFVKTTGGTTNIFFDGEGTNAIGSSTQGGIYSGGGTTNVTFSNGTKNTIAGKVDNEGANGTGGYNAIVNNGGNINIKVNNASLNIAGDIWHRFRGNTTKFYATGENSSITLANLGIHGDNNDNKYVAFDFADGGNLTFNTITLKNDNQKKPKVVFTFGGNGIIKGGITSNRSDAQAIFNLGNSSEQDETIAQRELARKGSITFSGGGNQTINFNGSNFTFSQQDASGGSSSLSIGNANAIHTINFNAKNGIFNATSIDVSNGANKINIANNASGTITGSINTTNSGNTTATFSGTSTLTLQGTSNTLTSIVASQTPAQGNTPTSTLIIDGTSHENSTSTGSVTNGENLVVNFRGTNNNKTFAITSGTATIKALTFDPNSKNNTFDASGTSTTNLLTALNITASQGLNVVLKDTTFTTNGWSTASGGTSTITVGGNSVTSANGILRGGNVQITEVVLNATDSASLTLQNSSTMIDTLTSTGGSNSNTFALDSSLGNAVSATIENQVDGSNLILAFNGGEDRNTSLTLKDGGNTFKTIQLGLSGSEQSTHNTLILEKGTTTITNSFNVGENNTQEIAFNLANDTELSLGGLTLENQGFAYLNVAPNASATLSGGTIGLTELTLQGNSASTITFKTTNATINTFNAGATTNNVTLGNGTENVSATLKSMKNGSATIDTLTYTGTGGTQTLAINSGKNIIKNITLSSATNALAINGGTTTIQSAISASSGQTFNLNLSSDSTKASDTNVVLNEALSNSGGGAINVVFSGGINPADQIHHSTLWLKRQDNQIDSIKSDASNGVILFEGTAGATIGSATITSVSSAPSVTDPDAPSTLSTSTTGGSLTFAFRGEGTSNVTINGSGITVGNGATLGISLGGSGQKNVTGNINFQAGSTLLVDFLDGNSANATLGSNGAFTINEGSYSIINFHGSNEGQINDGGITIAGGNNTVNFIGSSRMKGLILNSGTNTINVYGKSSTGKEIVGEIVTGEVSSVTNTINLNDHSTLKLLSDENDTVGNGTLTSTSLNNTLNFLGDNATLKGGFGANSGGGTATINVGDTNNANISVNGTITGEVSNATLAFKTNNSTLTLQNTSNALTSATSEVENAKILMKDTAGAEITSINLGNNGTLVFGFEGTGNSTITLGNGTDTINIASGQTLGISIGGSGVRNLSVVGKNGSGESKSNIAFADGSTLLIDFQRTKNGDDITATLGNNGQSFNITGTSKSIINLRGGEGQSRLNGSITLDGGTNTINFLDTATMGDVITLTSGTNNINVNGADSADKAITGTMAVSRVGGVNNTINLGDHSTLNLLSEENGATGSGELKTTATNTINFDGVNATLQGGFGTESGGNASINVKNTGALITGNVSNASVNFSEVDGSTLTLQGATNTLNALGSTGEGIAGTIILDATHNDSVSAEITSPVLATSSVGLKFGSGDKAKKFKFSANNNNLAGVEFDASGSTNNTLSFTSTGNAISNAFVIAQGQGLSIDLQNGSDLDIAGLSTTGSGEANLQSTGTTTLKGGDVNVATLSLLKDTTNLLTLQNLDTTIGALEIDSTAEDTDAFGIKLDTTSNAVNTTISNTLEGDKLAITLAGTSATNTATLNLDGEDNIINALEFTGSYNTFNLNEANNTISTLSLDTSSTNNTLVLNKGKTTISSNVSVGATQGIGFNLANETILEFGGDGVFENSGSATFNIQGANTTLNGAINANGGTTTLSMSDGSSLTLTDGLSTTGGTTTIRLTGTSSITGDISTSSGDDISTALNYAENNASLTLKNGEQVVSTLSLVDGSTSTLNLQQATTTIGNDLTLANSKTLNVNIDGSSSLALASVSTTNGALRVNGEGSLIANNITSSSTSGSNVINVGTLTINGLTVSQGSQNTITADTLTISGNISADSSSANSNKNIITANTATFSGNITSGDGNGGWLSQNFITINERATFSGSSTTINAKQESNTGRPKTNYFKFGGAVDGTIVELVATTKNSGSNTEIFRTKNILSFNGNASSSLEIKDINKTIGEASGYVYIGANLNADNSDGTEDPKFTTFEKSWSSSNYTANLDLTITNTIQAKYGKNFINVKSLSVGNTIYGNAGTNNIATSENFTASKIQAYWGGTNNIIIGGDAEIGGIEATYTSGDNSTNSNNITFAGLASSSVIKSDIVANSTNGKNNLTLQGSNATLTLQGKDAGGTTHAITKLDASGENTTLVLDNSKVTSGAMNTAISTLNGNNLTAVLKGSSDNNITLAIGGGTLGTLALGEKSTGNILDLSNATSTLNITNQVNVGEGQDLTIKFQNGSTLNLVGGLNTDDGTSTIALGEKPTVNDDGVTDGDAGNTQVDGGSQRNVDSATGTLAGGAINISKLELNGTTSNTLTISNSSAVINDIEMQENSNNTLNLRRGTRTTIASAINVSDSNLLSFDVNNSTLIFGSSENTITSLTSEGGLIDLSQGVKPVEDTSSSDSLAQTPAPVLLARGLVREGEESGVVTTPDAQNPSTDVNTPQAPSVDDNVSQEPSTPSKPIVSRDARNTLIINNGLTGTATFKLYANSNTADRVVFKATTPEATPPAENTPEGNPVEGASLKTTPTGTAIIAITGDSDVYNIKFDENGSDNIMVADVKGANGTVAVEGGESMIGVSTAVVNLIEKDGQYFIGDVVEGELNQSLQAIASSALAVNYDLYLANFNSLNKRMGELRNNEDSNGVWARVFGGNMSNSFGAGSKTDYITAQAGYDYSLSVGNNAKNFTGIAIAYGSSNTKSNTLGINAIGTPFANIALDKVSSNMVEVGVYNSYVADSGWYNDTILKFDYIMSEFSLSNDPSTMSKTNNFAMVLSDEFGYRYSFGVSEKGSWYIDPQAEFAFGYFNQSDFNRAVLNSDKVPANLQASQDAILTLRSRIGATLGKKFITDKGFASLYVGASYEYDYIEGGNSEAGSGSGRVITQLDKVESNGRAVLNVGSNIELTKGARLYIDVEKSFGDKQRTFMQFNLGARYSF